MPGSGNFAVIPVKRFDTAKQRMSPCLTPDERETLARAMFEDVLAAALAARSLSGVMVITCDSRATDIAVKAGAILLKEPGQYGYATAVNIAAHELRRMGADGMLVIPTDIPHVCPGLIDEVMMRTPSPGVTLIPARGDGGTNMLAMCPPCLISPQFGPDSLSRHTTAARTAGVEPLILTSQIAGHDIDQPNDLLDFLALNTPTRSHTLLAGWNITQRRRDGMV